MLDRFILVYILYYYVYGSVTVGCDFDFIDILIVVHGYGYLYSISCDYFLPVRFPCHYLSDFYFSFIQVGFFRASLYMPFTS